MTTESASDMWSLKSNFIRWSLHFFNTLMLLGAIGLTVTGFLLRSSYQYEFIFARGDMDRLTFILLVVGIMMIVIALLSFISLSQCGNSIMHAVIIMFLMVATALLAGYGVWTYQLYANDTLVKLARPQINETFHQYVEKNDEMLQTIEIDRVQSKFKCCGLESYKDWQNTDEHSLLAISKYEQLISPEQIPFDLPDTCCKNISEGCGKNFRFKSKIHVHGCYRPFLEYLSARVFFIACLALGIASINILAVVYLITICVILKGDYNAPIFLADANAEEDYSEENESLQVKELDW